jgi:hypothetical protein
LVVGEIAMAMTQLRKSPDLLKAVELMGPEEFDTFIEQALSLHARPKAVTLSAAETKLIKRINRGLPNDLSSRYAQLLRKRKQGALSDDDHRELLKLTHEMESRDADRAAALLELAGVRRVPIRFLMKQMGIKAAPVHG